jgi:hypothetical protein
VCALTRNKSLNTEKCMDYSFAKTSFRARRKLIKAYDTRLEEELLSSQQLFKLNGR